MTDLAKVALRLFRTLNPASRAQSDFRYTLNSCSRRQRGCIYCGYVTRTWCGNWPRTKQSQHDEDNHDCTIAYLASRLDNPAALARAYGHD